MKKKKQTFYTIYSYNKFNNDFEYVEEYTNIEDLKKEMVKKGINEKGIYNYITDNIDNIKKLVNGRLAIVKDIEIIEE